MKDKVILGIGAHADDLELGMGGFMAKYPVEMFVYGNGRGDPLDQRFDTIPILEITQAIEAKIAEVKPEIVFTHSIHDVNKDHRIIHEATMVACRPLPDSTVKEIYCYEVTPYDDFKPNTWLEINGIEKGYKWNSFVQQYGIESRREPHPRSFGGVKALAEYRGLQVGVIYAEAYECIRRVM